MTASDGWMIECAVGQKTVAVAADAIIGAFAVHQRFVGGQPVGPGWSVTHVATGKSVWRTREFADAVRVAEYLVRAAIIPEGRVECLAWRESLSTADLAELIERLTALAPLVQPSLNEESWWR